MVNVVKNLDVCVEIYHLAVLLKLPITQNKTRLLLITNYILVFRKAIVVKIYACNKICMKWKYLPNTEFGVVEDIVRH